VNQTGSSPSKPELANIESINWNTEPQYQRSVITKHRREQAHDFDWDNVKILDQKKILNKRLISEMIFIRKQKNSLNIQSDTIH